MLRSMPTAQTTGMAMFLPPDELVSTATCRAYGGVDEDAGAAVAASEVARRVSLAVELADILGHIMLADHYSPSGLATLAAGKDLDGRELPSRGYVAARRLDWGCPSAEGLYLPDRFYRVVEEQALRRLRQSVWLGGVVDAVVATWPKDQSRRTPGEWAALNAALPAEVDKATVRNRTRQVGSFLGEHGRLPAGLCDLEPDARFGPTLPLAAADRQLVTVSTDGSRGLSLRVKLPRVAVPEKRSDWSWVVLAVRLPDNVPDGAEVKTPTLRVVNDRVRVDLPWTQKMRAVRKDGHKVGFAYDWGVNTFLAGALCWVDVHGTVRTDGKPFYFVTAGAVAKVHRLRRQREVLHAKARSLKALAAGLPETSEERSRLLSRAEAHLREATAVSAKQSHLNSSISWAGARWVVDQAAANGASVIYAEDLSTMESRGLGRQTNTRVSNAVRSELLEAVRHLARKAGIAVVTVPARGTSSDCPRCLSKLRHCPAPNRQDEAGHKWSICRSCGLSADRDHAAAERICSRGLSAQDKVFLNRSRGGLECRSIVEAKVRRTLRPSTKRSRDKFRATPKQISHRARLTGPAPTSNGALALEQQRPVGTRSTESMLTSETGQTVQAARRRRYSRHRKALGRGFHHNVYATAVDPRPQWNKTSDHLASSLATKPCLGN